MSIKKTLFKNTAFNLFGYIYLLGVSFYSISILLGNLGRDLFGVYIFLASFVPIASVFDFGVSIALIRDLASSDISESEKKKVWQSGLFIFLLQALFLGFFFFGLVTLLFHQLPLLNTYFNSTNIYFLSFVIGVTIFLNHVNNAFLSIPQALQRFDVYNSKTYLVGTANTLFTAWLTYYTQDLSLVFLMQFLFHIVTFLYILNFGKKHIGGGVLTPVYTASIGKRLFGFGIKNFVGTLAGQIEAQASKFFLGLLSTAQSITAFNIPQSIFQKGAGVVSQVAQAFFPLSATLLNKDRIIKLRNLYLFLQGSILFSGLLVVYLTFGYGNVFLSWWLGDPIIVDISFPILRILSIYFVLLSLTPLPTALLQGLGKPQIPSFFAVLTTGLEIAFMFLLIPKYQALGAAYSFLATISITSPLFLVYSFVVFNHHLKKTQLPDET